MNILCITNLFPDSSRPGLAPFNRQQLMRLADIHRLRVIVPVPWPHRLMTALKGERIKPPSGCGESMDIDYPTYFYTPLGLRNLYRKFYRESIRPVFERALSEFEPELLYATWAYPDCCAAADLAEEHGLPLVSRVHGSDINRFFDYPRRRRMIVEAMNYSGAVISVSRPLMEKMAEAGVERNRIELLLNGVDRELFRSMPRDEARAAAGIDPEAEVILFAGNLNKGKGAAILLEAFEDLGRPVSQLHIIGEGPERKKLLKMIRNSSRGDDIFLHGRIAHREMPVWYNSCDVFCLPSLNEGTPNVIIEALSCSRPVVASRTGGIPDIVDGESGILFAAGDRAELAGALEEALTREWNRDGITCPAGDWSENAAELSRILSLSRSGN